MFRKAEGGCRRLLCIGACLQEFARVGVRKISHLLEEEKDQASRVFVFASPALMTAAAQAPVSVCWGRKGGNVSNSDIQVKKNIARGGY